jgi:hypothetical protein
MAEALFHLDEILEWVTTNPVRVQLQHGDPRMR